MECNSLHFEVCCLVLHIVSFDSIELVCCRVRIQANWEVVGFD